MCSQLPRQVLQPHWGGPGTPSAKPSPCSELFLSTDGLWGWFFTFSRTYLLLWGDLSPQALVFFGFRRSSAVLLPLCFRVRGLFWAVVASSQAVEVMCSNSVLLWSGDRFAAARLVVLSHTQVFPFVIHPGQSRYWLQTSMEVDILFYVCT